MQKNLIELQQQILQNRLYLNRHYDNTELLLSQVAQIVSHEIAEQEVQKWLDFNKIAVTIVLDILETRNKKYGE
jgi:hypothetical protein